MEILIVGVLLALIATTWLIYRLAASLQVKQ
jgi:hypothetical protein